MGGDRGMSRTTLAADRLEDRIAPAWITSYAGGNIRIQSIYDTAGGFINLREEIFRPFDDFTGQLNSAFDEASRIAVVAPAVDGGPRVQVRRVDVDGPDEILADFFAYEPTFMGGVNVALGDYTGDGVVDVITGPRFGGGPRLRVFDGVTFEPVVNEFLFEPTFLGGIDVGFSNGRTYALAGRDGGPRVKVIGVGDWFIGPVEDRGDRELLVGTLLGTRDTYVASWDGERVYLYDEDFNFLVSRPAAVPSVGIGGNFFAQSPRIMLADFQIAEWDAVLDRRMAGEPLYVQDFRLGNVTGAPVFTESVVQADAMTVKPGDSIGNFRGTGTLTTRIGDFGLTNEHVAGAEGALIFSPGPADSGATTYLGFTRYVSGVKYDGTPNLIDSALFDLSLSDDVVGLDVGTLPANVGDLVYAFGRTSIVSVGTVVESSAEVTVTYPGNRDANFIEQLVIESAKLPYGFSLPGDSGSPVLTPRFDGRGGVTWHLVGQVFAGGATVGIASRWENVSAWVNSVMSSP